MKKIIFWALLILGTTSNTISSGADEAFSLKDVDTPPRVIKAVRPSYEGFEFTLDGVFVHEGEVMIRFIVTKDGNAKDCEVIKSIPKGAFDKIALDAIKQFQFQPATKDGKPVDCYVRQPMDFSVPGYETAYDAFKESEKGQKYFIAGEYDKAIEAFNRAIKKSKKYSGGYAGRGMTYIEMGEYAKAIDDLDRAMRLTPGSSVIYRLRGNAHKALEEYDKALEDYQTAIDKEPGVKDDHFNRGEIYRKINKYKEAVREYSKVIELDNGNTQAYNNRAVSYNKLDDNVNMCLDLKKACELGDCRGIESAAKAGKCEDSTNKVSEAGQP